MSSKKRIMPRTMGATERALTVLAREREQARKAAKTNPIIANQMRSKMMKFSRGRGPGHVLGHAQGDAKVRQTWTLP